jgi:hypothetical protein
MGGGGLAAQLVCYLHGGKAPHSIAFAKRRQALDAVKSHVSRIVAYDGDDVTSPEEGLLMEVKWSGQVAIALGDACEALIADEQLTTKSAGAGGAHRCTEGRATLCPSARCRCACKDRPMKVAE